MSLDVVLAVVSVDGKQKRFNMDGKWYALPFHFYGGHCTRLGWAVEQTGLELNPDADGENGGAFVDMRPTHLVKVVKAANELLEAPSAQVPVAHKREIRRWLKHVENIYGELITRPKLRVRYTES